MRADHDAPDAVLMRAWELCLEDQTEAVENELEPVIPILVAYGHAEADEYTWNFTPSGVARIEQLEAKGSR